MTDMDQAAAKVVGGNDADPVGAAADAVLSGQSTAVRASLYTSLMANPEVAARATKLGRQTGLPVDVVQRNIGQVERDVMLNDVERYIRSSPALASALQRPEFASMAHDDVSALGSVERAVRDLFGGARRSVPRGPVPVMSGREFSQEAARVRQMSPGLDEQTATALAAQGVRIDNTQQFVDVARGPAPTARSVAAGLFNADRLRASSAGMSLAAADVLGLDPAPFVRRYETAQARATARDPEFETATGKGIYAGGVSLVQNAPGLALGLVSGGAALPLSAMGAQVAGQEYGKYRARGATAGQAAVGAGLEAGIEVATELLPMRFLVDRLGKTGVTQFLTGLLAREVPGEQIATLAQDAVDTAIANPDKTWGQYLRERPEAAYQTLLATLAQGGAMGALNVAAMKITGMDGEAQRAQDVADRLDALMKFGEATKLKARDSESFKQFVEQVAEDGEAPAELYVDAQQLANSLSQSGMTMAEFQAIAPAAAAQLEAAQFVPGADIRVPVAELSAAPSTLTAPLLDHLREAPESMSRAEAQEYLNTQGDAIRAEIDRELSRQAQDSEASAQTDGIVRRFEEELKAVGRFRPEVNRAYATMLGSFYGTMAQRLGVSPQELVDRYQLHVRAKGIAGRNVVSQASGSAVVADQTETPEFKAWSSEAPLYAPDELRSYEGGAAVFKLYHGTASDFTEFDRERANIESDLGAGFYFTNNPRDVSSNYAGEGPDLTQRIQLLAERIASETDRDYSDPEVIAEAKEKLAVQHGGMAMPVFVRVKNPVVVGGSNETFLDYEQPYDEETDEYGEETGSLVDFIVALRDVAGRYNDGEVEVAVDAVMRHAMYNGGISASELIAAIKGAEEFGYYTDDNGTLASTEIIRQAFEAAGFDGIVDYTVNEKFGSERQIGKSMEGMDEDTVHVIAFEPTQIKSAIGNRGTFDPNDPNILNQQEDRATLSFGDDITQSPSIITLLEGADWSSFIHESGHFFLEVMGDLAIRIRTQVSEGASVTDGERQILNDMDAVLAWVGVKGDGDVTALDRWSMMSLDERRDAHELFARGFERYAMEGNAPSIELKGVFSRFRDWLKRVYKKLTELNAPLTDEVRQVMGRMLATDQAIEEMQAQRAMGALFRDAESAGMTLEEYRAYQALGSDATETAKAELQARSLQDMKWMSRARSKELKKLQAEADDLRRDVEREMRAEVMQYPVYQVWQFLTGKGDRVADPARPLGIEADGLLKTIAKLGGLRRDEVRSMWGVDEAPSGVFGAPVLRANGGMPIDMMAEALADAGYLSRDEYGRADDSELERLFMRELSGDVQYSNRRAVGADALRLLDFDSGKLKTSDLRGMYGTSDTAVWRVLSERGMTSDAGIDPEVVAATFGYQSADQMVRELAEASPPDEIVATLTDITMLERYGDVASPEAMQRAADEAVHNEARLRFIAHELKALEKATSVRAGRRSTIDVLASAARDYAAEIVGRQRIRDLRPAQYGAAEARSAKLAEKAIGKLEEAAMHKRNQLVNAYAAKAAMAAQDEVSRGVKYLRKFERDGVRKNLPPDYLDQIDQMLERFDLKQASGREIDRRKALAAWVKEQNDAGLDPMVPDELLERANLTNYRDMTVEEFRELVDSIKGIEHLGRLKGKLLKAADEREFAAVASEIVASISAHGGEKRPVKLEPDGKAVQLARGFWIDHRKLNSLVRQMDGGVDNGPFYRALVRSMNDAGALENSMIEKATVDLARIYAPVLSLPGGLTGAKVSIPSIGASLSRGARLAIALNWGNEQNRQRVMDGDGWNESQVMDILRTLSPVELAFVNQVWEHLDSYWPDVKAKQERVYGRVEQKVQALPFAVTASDGTTVPMRGGYYPIKYDADRSLRAERKDAEEIGKEMLRGAIGKATTRRSHTKARSEEVKGRPVRKDLSTITQHVTQVVHDLAWHEWVIDANRLLDDPSIGQAIRDYYGPEYLRSMKDAVTAIAVGDLASQTAIDGMLMKMRANVTRSIMGLSLTTAFLQPFGLTQSMVRIGTVPVLKGAARWAGDAAQMTNSMAWISEKSEFMRLRSKTFNRDLREINQRVQGRWKITQVLDASLFMLMQKLQMVADVPTWIGAYEKALSQGVDEAAAVALADEAVLSSQGGGDMKDLSAVQRDHPFLTQFYSYFNATLQLAAERTAQTEFKNPRAAAGWLGDMTLLLVIPAILPAMLTYLLKGGGEDDDPEEWAKKMAQWQAAYLFGMFVGLREIPVLWSPFEYGGPPVAKLINDGRRFVQQAGQGEIDDQAVLATIGLMGTVFGLPTTQVVRSYKGWQAWDEGNAPASAILFGPPPKD